MGRVSGKKTEAQRVVIYGPEGIGKSTLASRFPGAVFVDVEDGTGQLNVERFDQVPSSYEMMVNAIEELRHETDVHTIVIDTIDAAEGLCIRHVCAKDGKDGIEDYGYGKGYTYLSEQMGKFLNYLNVIKNEGINVVFLAHSTIRKFEQPDEMGAYDRYELKLEKKTAPLIKEWADAVLFMNYETFVIEDEKTKSKKAQGGQRVIHTSHHSCWDAKNRWGLPEKITADFAQFAHCIPVINRETVASQPALKQETKCLDRKPIDIPETPVPTEPPEKTKQAIHKAFEQTVLGTSSDLPTYIPKNLAQLMEFNSVTELEVQAAVGRAGYYPADTSIQNYDTAFIDAVLVARWDGVYKNILENRK